MLDERKLRLYRYLLSIERIQIEEIPEEYRAELDPD